MTAQTGKLFNAMKAQFFAKTEVPKIAISDARLGLRQRATEID